METQHYINLETQYGANNYAPLDVVITKGQGIWVEDVDGNRYVDCLSAYSAVSQGHCHSRCPEALPICSEMVPKFENLGEHHQAACLLLGDGEQVIA